MNLTSKSRYAIKIIMDLAVQDHSLPIQRRGIVARQGIPSDYLDQIMMLLRRAGIISSSRGRYGGYKLSRPLAEISVYEIFEAVEGSIAPVQCVSDHLACDYQDNCVSSDAWQQIYMQMTQPLKKLFIADLLESMSASTAFYKSCPAGGLRECRAPSVDRPTDTEQRAL